MNTRGHSPVSRKVLLVSAAVALTLSSCYHPWYDDPVSVGPAAWDSYLYCDTSWDCPDVMYCGYTGVCRFYGGCWNDWDCLTGYACGEDGACYKAWVPECYDDYDCAPGYYCGADAFCY